jgi:hypothetical protein
VNCELARNTLRSSGPRDELPGGVAEHLAGCAECRALAESYRALDADLSSLYASGFELGMCEPMLAALPARPRPARRFWLRLAAAAAALLLLASGAWLTGRTLLPGAAQYPRELAVSGSEPAIFESVEGARVCARAGSRLAVAGPRLLRLSDGGLFLDVEPGKGGFAVEVPGGRVAVLGTEFSVIVTGETVRVAVRRGRVSVENQRGTVTLAAGQAGQFGRGEGDVSPAAPGLLPGVSVAGETLWRPWKWLNAEERAERLEHLRGMLSGEDYALRVAARDSLAGAGADGFRAAASWTAAESPRLRLEAVLFLRGAPADLAEARAALARVAADAREQPGIRDQARVSIEEIDRRAAGQDAPR